MAADYIVNEVKTCHVFNIINTIYVKEDIENAVTSKFHVSQFNTVNKSTL